MNKYERSYELANKKSHAGWYDAAIAPLAADLEAATGKPVKISGPFGLRAEVYIDVGDDFIRITPEFPDDGLKLYYDTGEMTQAYQPLTLGDCNGMNNVRAPLPDTLEEIIKALRPLKVGNHIQVMIEKMRETEELKERELGRPFSVISSNPKYNSYYLENIIKTKWLKKLNEMEEAQCS